MTTDRTADWKCRASHHTIDCPKINQPEGATHD